MKNTLYNQLLKYRNNIYPFHMPGHKLGKKIKFRNMAKIDVTEVKGTDNLHNPCGIIEKAQEKAAKTFGADKTYFLVNGSTGGIISAISSICEEKDQILIARNSHKSVYNAILINNLEPIYIYPQILNKNGLIGGISPDDLEQKIKENSMIKLVVITSPTYEGFISDIRKISDIVHKYNKILMVDEAHGSHFKFNDYFPKTSLELGVDIVIQSAHKTLPSLTQSAMLHIKSDKIDSRKLQNALSIFQTSSPSYILMTSLDDCRDMIDTKGSKLFARYVHNLKDCRYKLKTQLTNLELIDQEVIGNKYIFDMDCSKIVIDCTETDITGTRLDEILRNKYNIQVELSGINHIIAMTSICDGKSGFRKLVKALVEIDSKLRKNHIINNKYDIIYNTQTCYNPKEASTKNKYKIQLENAAGRISGDFVIPFPPGIPLIIPGEVITTENINLINEYTDIGIEIMGLDDKKNKTINIIDEV
ncbi:lysine decarboxylase [Vallitalea longa]|uniref:Lysine decarboxylase n=1 Tax=Vallitalea longa TaxID=2936439 RepID=A0A9W6DGE5_9FIRM|nr:aminotransferase class I/II-fold pyridoxal phosphate-dependent enzyme [Vallitalea longa]GKX32221.1 lysine decarboxylase [Vallitalea longa]